MSDHEDPAPDDPDPASKPAGDGSSDAAAALQQAALGAIGALRGLLDAAEEVVADSDRVGDLVSGVTSWAERLGEHLGADGGSHPEADEAPSSPGSSGHEPAARGPRRVPLD
ncbi:MAG: hypothetical protein R2754_03645 [Microthrixaceae bacterium]